MIRVLICDDQEIVRKGLKIILDHTEGITVVGTAENGAEAVEMVGLMLPHVVLMDLKMPVLNGVLATKQIKQNHPTIQIIILTTFDADQWVLDAIKAGANGYLLKDSDGEQIIQAIRDAAENKPHIDPAVAGTVLAALQNSKPEAERPRTNRKEKRAPAVRVSQRERDILRLVARGLSNPQIAADLNLSLGTVKNYVSRLRGKFHAETRVELVNKVREAGITP